MNAECTINGVSWIRTDRHGIDEVGKESGVFQCVTIAAIEYVLKETGLFTDLEIGLALHGGIQAKMIADAIREVNPG